ncbi:hypothetical protein NX10_09595 [Pseudomonas fluorescens]|nr:hypothetical protein NX10_09595 [Pseudomonas fluorescens]
MFVLSRVVVGLAKKSSYKRQADSCKTEAFLYLEIHTGLSGTNRQSGREGRIFGIADDAFASRLAPTGERISTVGASLLAKTD